MRDNTSNLAKLLDDGLRARVGLVDPAHREHKQEGSDTGGIEDA
jgi:hypothetical protein